MVLIILFVLITPVQAADRKAVLDDGTVVILHDNGTWEPVSATAHLETSGSFDVRKVRWGMLKSEVMQQEPGEFVVQDTSLVYEVTLLDIHTLLLYNFTGERLVGAGYLVNEKLCGFPIDEQLFLRFKGLLTEKYGPMQELPAEYSFFKPKYPLTGFWETERSHILLVGDDTQIGIFYESTVTESTEEQNDLNDL